MSLKMIEAFILKWCDNCQKFCSHKIIIDLEQEKIFYECINCETKSEQKMYRVKEINKESNK